MHRYKPGAVCQACCQSSLPRCQSSLLHCQSSLLRCRSSLLRRSVARRTFVSQAAPYRAHGLFLLLIRMWPVGTGATRDWLSSSIRQAKTESWAAKPGRPGQPGQPALRPGVQHVSRKPRFVTLCDEFCRVVTVESECHSTGCARMEHKHGPMLSASHSMCQAYGRCGHCDFSFGIDRDHFWFAGNYDSPSYALGHFASCW